ncbi:hypothetical protein [Actinokineospora diospyrosa]|uniref:Uncharacterized protein n=1 Tax=Actinokineospora diospyrosa TaxID=103728 RepID=A0ABT1IH90_9PSEU|nr:hypothetical protein [Actinokineospora diospyrosa]MCP2271926.1 hypothetical protein [Actinokineospora diospyrosa]
MTAVLGRPTMADESGVVVRFARGQRPGTVWLERVAPTDPGTSREYEARYRREIVRGQRQSWTLGGHFTAGEAAAALSAVTGFGSTPARIAASVLDGYDRLGSDTVRHLAHVAAQVQAGRANADDTAWFHQHWTSPAHRDRCVQAAAVLIGAAR